MIGAHVSIAGGIENAPRNGRRIGCEAIQVFTRSQRRWRSPPLSRDAALRFREAARAAGLGPSVAHASYLFNLAGGAPIRKLSREGLLDEWDRTEALGLLGIVVHPGAHLGKGAPEGVARAVRTLNAVARLRPRHRSLIILENTAGQGTCLASRFEEIAAIFRELERPDLFGVCLDTAHLFAAGWDIRSEKGMFAALEEFDRVVGIGKIRTFHLNDSKAPLGSRVDRHEHVGRGLIGIEPFRAIVKDPRFRDVPKLIEIPGSDGLYRRDIKLLKGLRSKA
jgi:deoxyribonuclease IV